MKLSVGDWYIRSYEDSDVSALAKYANNHNVWITLTNQFPHPYTENDAKQWIKHIRSKDIETHFAITNAKEAFGCIGFDFKKDIHCKTVSLGYWIGEAYWGQGIVSEAVRMMTDYIFTHYDVIRIQAGVFETNLASVRILEKAGYILEARLRKHVFKDNEIQDLFIYACLRHEWEERTQEGGNA